MSKLKYCSFEFDVKQQSINQTFMILGQCKGQLYSYPAKRWKKKKRLAFMNTECKKTSDIETGEAGMYNVHVEYYLCISFIFS